MNVPTPHYLLFSTTNESCDLGRWQFVLKTEDGSEHFEAADIEPGVCGERLDLLTVVRALESLDQPSRVTLVGCSPYVRQGMDYGLSQWRDNGWRWEFFGQMVPVKNGDLWQRMDQALQFHRVDCRIRRFDPPHSRPQLRVVGGEDYLTEEEPSGGIRTAGTPELRYRALPDSTDMAARCRRWLAALGFGALARLWRQRIMRSWTVPAWRRRAG